ncbi:MAG: DUF3575 domain-containing protein [Flavobacteriales bacterium]
MLKNLQLCVILLLPFMGFSQTFKVSENVLGTSLYQPFAKISGYSLAFERMLDPGYSKNVAQFSYKLTASLLSDQEKSEIREYEGQSFFDLDAYQYSGYMAVPELRYYFTWDAPMGVYINLFGTYTSYLESFTDVVDEKNGYDKKHSVIGRGIGAGFQFKIYGDFCLDITGGYHLKNISSKTKTFGVNDFEDNPDSKNDQLYINVFLGVNF